jgi:hypothetical protein
MSAARPPRRSTLRALLVLGLLAGSLLGLPDLRSNAAPQTVVRTSSIDVTALERPGRTARTATGLVALASGRGGGSVTTDAVTTCAPIWFDGLAVTWTRVGGRPPRLRVATAPSRSGISDASLLDAEGGPDPGTAEGTRAAGGEGSEYLWTGGSRCIRLRFELRPGTTIGSPRLVFVNTTGTAAGPGTGPRDVGPSLATPASLPAADAATREPNLITRQEWGADPDLMNCTPDVAPFLTNAFVHHTAGSNGYTRSQADDVVRGIYAYHTRVRGWCDIGYNFLVDRYGDVFEGRSGGVTTNVIGAAQMGFNTGAFSVSVMGTFDHVAPPRAAIRALQRILAWRLDVAHVNPASRHTMTSGGGSTTRYERGTQVRLHTISGHRDTGLTDCPGGRLYALLPRIRDRVARIGLPKLYAPRLSVGSIVANEATPIRITARGSARLDWSLAVADADGDVVADLPGQRDDRLSVRWDALLATPGRYAVLIWARDARGRRAMPASLPLRVRPEPTPSPSPSPSP